MVLFFYIYIISNVLLIFSYFWYIIDKYEAIKYIGSVDMKKIISILTLIVVMMCGISYAEVVDTDKTIKVGIAGN